MIEPNVLNLTIYVLILRYIKLHKNSKTIIEFIFQKVSQAQFHLERLPKLSFLPLCYYIFSRFFRYLAHKFFILFFKGFFPILKISNNYTTHDFFPLFKKKRRTTISDDTPSATWLTINLCTICLIDISTCSHLKCCSR